MSIRKTKKRLKREIVDNNELLFALERVKFPTLKQCYLYSVIRKSTDLLKQELQQLKRKKV